MNRKIIFILMIPLWAWTELIDQEDIWKLKMQKDGIRIYLHKNPPKEIIPLKAEMLVTNRMEEVIAVLDDKKRRMDWVKNFLGNRLIEKRTLYDQVEYSRFSMPLWLSQRSTLVKIKIVVLDNGKKVFIHGHSIEKKNVQDDKGYIRARIFDSSIKLEQVDEGTRIYLITYADPNGSIPSWVVNLLTKGMAMKTMRNLRKQLKKDLYSEEYLARFKYRINHYERLKNHPFQMK